MTTKSKPTAKAKTIPATKAKTPAPAKAKTVASGKATNKATKISHLKATFTLYAPDAQEVFLLGDFNDWQNNDLKARRLKDGIWSKSVQLRAGNYQYLFLVDGEWWTDPANPNRVQNAFGTENSAVEIR